MHAKFGWGDGKETKALMNNGNALEMNKSKWEMQCENEINCERLDTSHPRLNK